MPCGLFWKGGEGSCSKQLSGSSPAANLAEQSSPGQQEFAVRRPPAALGRDPSCVEPRSTWGEDREATGTSLAARGTC